MREKGTGAGVFMDVTKRKDIRDDLGGGEKTRWWEKVYPEALEYMPPAERE